MRVQLVDVSYQHNLLRSQLEAAVWSVLGEPTCDGSRPLRELEDNFVKRFGGFAAGAQSGTAGIFLAVMALGIGPGDEVITVPNSDLPTTAAISHTGARFVLVDVEPDTFNIDPSKIEARITPRTRAIVPVHLYGNPADMDPIMEIARRHKLRVVEDACLALGATYKGRPCGTIGDLGVFSFAPRKILGCAGNGGMVITKDPALDHRVRQLRGYGLPPRLGDAPISVRLQSETAGHEVEGWNLKLDGVQAAILNVKFPYLDEWVAYRRRVAARYGEHFRGTAVVPPVVRPGCEHACRNYVVLTPHRDFVRQRLHEKGIVAGVLYIPPVHLQSVYQGLGYGPGSLPVAEDLAKRLLCLPVYPGMPMETADEVAETVKAALAEAAKS